MAIETHHEGHEEPEGHEGLSAMESSPVIGGLVWVVIIVLCGLVYWRMKTRRRHIGPGAAGTVYDMINEEKRNAVEILVEDKAAARDFEHADDDDEPGSGSRQPASESSGSVRGHRDKEPQS